MFSVIFEIHAKKERIKDYLDLAKELKPILEKIDGFVDNERFESKTRPGWLLSHSTWRDEKSVIRWRTQGRHHEVQETGRKEIMLDYHLRVGSVVNDTDPPSTAPIHEMRFDETEVSETKYATLTEVTLQGEGRRHAIVTEVPADLGLTIQAGRVADHDIFTSINNPGKLALLVAWKTIDEAKGFSPIPFRGVKALRHRLIRVVRDYGMFDRREAPQFYPNA